MKDEGAAVTMATADRHSAVRLKLCVSVCFCVWMFGTVHLFVCITMNFVD